MKYAEVGFLLAIMKQCFELKQQSLSLCAYVYVCMYMCASRPHLPICLFNRILSLVKKLKKLIDKCLKHVLLQEDR